MSEGEQDETAIYRRLKQGFAELSVDSADQTPQQSDPSAEKQNHNRSVEVHFLDPAVNSISTRATTTADKKQGQQPQQQQQQQRQSLNERFESIFQTVYNNRLTSVPYQDARSKANSSISSITVRPRFLESQVDLLQNFEDIVNNPESSINAWHTRPYCYVYFVTGCQTLEDYRTKVKPAIQVFLSQLTEIYQRQAMQLSAGSDDASPSYLLVYCPQRAPGSAPILPDQDQNDSTPNSAQRFSLANRFRQRMNRDSITTSPLDAPTTEAAMAAGAQPADAASSDTATTTSGSSDTPSGATATATSVEFNPLQVLTKVEKEVARRLAMDFPQGTVATLTTLGNDYASSYGNNASVKAALDELERNEWAALLTAFGKTVVHGFEGISNGLSRALRKISNQKKEDQGILGHYFLVKESLAFTYEQMNLPAEALLQYNELRVFLPDLKKTLEFQNPNEQEQDVLEGIVEERKQTKMPKPATPIWKVKDEDTSTTTFRKRIQALHYEDYYQEAAAVEFYLWQREASLYFLMGDGVHVVKRSLQFCTALWEYHHKLNFFANKAKEDSNDKEFEVMLEEWAFSFCWDVTRAAQGYLLQLEAAAASKRTVPLEAVGRLLCDVVGFSRLRFRTLAKLRQFSICGDGAKYKDVSNPWDAWVPPGAAAASSSSGEGANAKPARHSLTQSGSGFLQKAFSDQQDFVAQYTDALKIYIYLCNLCGRHRSAARLAMELTDLHVGQGQTQEAAKAMQSIVKVYARDGWTACHFLSQFRSAGFRRNQVPQDYLATLVQSFSRHTDRDKFVAPPKAVELLCEDFEAVTAFLSSTDEGERKEAIYVNSPVFEASLRLPDAKKRKPSSQRKLVRKVYAAGTVVKFTLSLASHLPHKVEDVAVTVSLVPHKVYMSAQKQKRPIEPKDICHTISLPNRMELVPGDNDIGVDFTPTVSGQFVVSHITLDYKSTKFIYTSDKMREAGFWVDVNPPDPSQRMHLKPVFLIPGHEQKLQIEFHSGNDHVVGGELNLVCSPGLVLLPPDEEEKEGGKWLSSWQCPLEECPPGEHRTYHVSVTGVTGQSFDESEGASVATVIPTVHAKITSTYRCGSKNGEKLAGNAEATISEFQHEMESVIPSLADSALSVDTVSLNPCGPNKVILNVAAKCHVPAPFVLKQWELHLPSYLKDPAGSTDMNDTVADTVLVKGETVSFVFDCGTGADSEGLIGEQPALIAHVEDEYGSTFQEQLLLRLKKPTALPASALPEKIHNMVVRTESSSAEGTVGVPILLTYTVDSSVFTEFAGVISYTLDFNGDWLISGQTKGVVFLGESEEWKLSFSAIPTRPGSLTHLPLIEFKFDGGGLQVPYVLSVPLENKDRSFRSVLPLQQSAIAFKTVTSG